jgi:4-hydroxybenzoate polyprenyltransferase
MNTIFASVKEIKLKTSEKTSYVIAFLVAFVYFFQLRERSFLYLFPLALLAIAYSVPLLKSKGRKVRIKEIFFIKTPVIALVWSLTTTVIPLVEQNISLQSSFVFWQIVSKTLFIFVLCIPFEIRDMEIDRKNNVSTLAVAHGRKFTLVIGVIIILFELVTHHLMNGLSAISIFALDLSSIAALLIILLQNSKRSPYYYKFLVDGTMVLRFLILLLLTRAV